MDLLLWALLGMIPGAIAGVVLWDRLERAAAARRAAKCTPPIRQDVAAWNATVRASLVRLLDRT